MKEELLKGLTKEQIEKARNCRSQEELLHLAKKEGIELTEEQLASVSGGACRMEQPDFICPSCGSKDIDADFDSFAYNSNGVYKCTCRSCGKFFEERP